MKQRVDIHLMFLTASRANNAKCQIIHISLNGAALTISEALEHYVITIDRFRPL